VWQAPHKRSIGDHDPQVFAAFIITSCGILRLPPQPYEPLQLFKKFQS